MSTKSRTQEVADESGDDRFTPVEPVRLLAEPTLKRMEEPTALVDEGVLMFAVASREGVLRTPGDTHEYQVTCVLYLDADGRRAVERFFRRGLETAPRGCVMPPEQLFQAKPNGSEHQHASQLAEHPEVDR